MNTKLNNYIQDSETEYKYLEQDIEDELKTILKDDLLNNIKDFYLLSFDDLIKNDFDYDSLKPYATINIQSKASDILFNKNIKHTIPEKINSLNRIISTIYDENDLLKKWDRLIIDYYIKQPKHWLDDRTRYVFSEIVLDRLNKPLEFNL